MTEERPRRATEPRASCLTVSLCVRARARAHVRGARRTRGNLGQENQKSPRFKNIRKGTTLPAYSYSITFWAGVAFPYMCVPHNDSILAPLQDPEGTLRGCGPPLYCVPSRASSGVTPSRGDGRRHVLWCVVASVT